MKERIRKLRERYDELTPEVQKQITEEVTQTFNYEIAAKLIRQQEPNVSDETINEVWGMCKGNPWDASALYIIMREAKK